MPLFVKNGPVIPDKLVQDLEEDRVVIFCGAGISMGAGLPDFKGLVTHCLTQLGATPPAKKSPEWLWLDRMLGDLECRFDAASVRKHVSNRLSQPPRDLALHRAILRLAQLKRSSGMRLVTTNFDHYFEEARGGLQLGIDYHSGPVLPIPRNDHALSWKSIVYLHGRLNPTGTNDHLVLTSADFGRAYLTDAWAARFVARLFADFTVLFIGYSLNDPVLRYMTDAFAAENASALSTPFGGPAYIFVPYRGIRPSDDLYRQRNLVPIFYHDYRNHSRLTKTLIAWASARDDFLTNTKRLISGIARSSPKSLDPSATSNLLWAVLGRPDEGHGARVFADINPSPSIEWLDEFERRENEVTEKYEASANKARIGGYAMPEPPPRPISSLFPIEADRRNLQLTNTAWELCRWMLGHLDDLNFVERVIAKLGAGRRLHGGFRHEIRRRLNGEHNLADGYLRFWRIVSAEGEWALGSQKGSYLQFRHLARSDDEISYIKQEILDSLQPILQLKPSYYGLWSRGEEGSPIGPMGETLGQIADAEVVLTREHTNSILEPNGGIGLANSYWSGMLMELTQVLVKVLDLYAIAGEATAEIDPSTFQRPSIVPHGQNRHREQWTKLIDRIWAGWTYLDNTDPAASKELIGVWRRIPYLTFRRLTLAAAAHTSHLRPNEKLDLLLNG